MKLTRIALLLSLTYVTLGVASCPKQLPKPPALQYGQCALNWPKGGEAALYCVNEGKRIKVPVHVQEAKGAQCLMPYDYNAMAQWMDQIIDIAQKRCD